MPHKALYEFIIRVGGEWLTVNKTAWLSWTGHRKLNGREYHGPIFYFGTTRLVTDRQARACPCIICQRTANAP